MKCVLWLRDSMRPAVSAARVKRLLTKHVNVDAEQKLKKQKCVCVLKLLLKHCDVILK